VGHDDHLATSRLDLLDLLRRQHRARADQAIGGQAVAQGADAGVRVRRIERHFDHAKPSLVQHLADGLGFVRANTAQDGDQTVLCECVLEHVRPPMQVE
jgi:hypothetical protein